MLRSDAHACLEGALPLSQEHVFQRQPVVNRPEEFARVDANNSGTIDIEEFKAPTS